MICPNCKSNISDETVLCPNCSYNVVAPNQKQDILNTEEFRKSVGLGCRLYIGIPFIVLGIILFVPLILYLYISSSYTKTEAEYKYITSDGICYYDYNINNKTYSYKKEDCDPSVDIVEILYDKNNPSKNVKVDYITKGDATLFTGIGILFIFFGSIFIFPKKSQLLKKVQHNYKGGNKNDL